MCIAISFFFLTTRFFKVLEHLFVHYISCHYRWLVVVLTALLFFFIVKKYKLPHLGGGCSTLSVDWLPIYNCVHQDCFPSAPAPFHIDNLGGRAIPILHLFSKPLVFLTLAFLEVGLCRVLLSFTSIGSPCLFPQSFLLQSEGPLLWTLASSPCLIPQSVLLQ